MQEEKSSLLRKTVRIPMRRRRRKNWKLDLTSCFQQKLDTRNWIEG
ncbi:MAG: hypothetical protein WAV32_03685 [Halobacteriota archaeon]